MDAESLLACLDAAIAAVRAGPALAKALATTEPPVRAPAVLAFGKASPEMAAAMVDWLRQHGTEPTGGIVVSHRPAATPHPRLPVLVGDHPVPGAASLAAAEALGATIASLDPLAPIEVLISGGTSALIGAPRSGPIAAFGEHVRELLGSGLSTAEMNRERRRQARWAAGRLSEALAGRRVRAWVLSDVPGDPLWAIGSGPLVADEFLPPEAPHTLIATNATALDAADVEARARGYDVVRHAIPLTGEPTEMGQEVVRRVRATRPDGPTLHLWGGETAARLPAAHGRSGRCQQLALSAASLLSGPLPGGARITLLSAGTDGQDGATDAAGALVSHDTWNAIESAGLDPTWHLDRYDAHRALDTVGAVVRTGPTGTNVADLLMVVVRPPQYSA